MKKTKLAGYYHNADDSFDPQIRYWSNGPNYAEGLSFTTGPFKTFAAAKKDMIQTYRSMEVAYRDSARFARTLSKADALGDDQ